MNDDELVTVSAKAIARLIEAAAWVVKENRSSILGWREVPAARVRELEAALREPLEGEAVGDRLETSERFVCPKCGSDELEETTEGALYLPGPLPHEPARWNCHACGAKGGRHSTPLADRFGGLEIE